MFHKPSLVLAALSLGLLIPATITHAQAATTNFDPVTSLQTVNYYTTMRNTASHNYKIYATGGYKTSANNLTEISTSHAFANRAIHITRTEIVNGTKWLKFTFNHTRTGWVNQNATIKSTYKLYVPLIAQRPQLPTGCEITATAMMLQFAGATVTKSGLAREMPRNKNPNKGFVGSPYKKSGWYIYPGGLTKLVKKHVGTSKNLTGAKLTTIKSYIHHNKPVVIWLGYFDGFSNHAVTVSGYTRTRLYFNDPWTYQRRSLSNAGFTHHRKLDAYRALSY
ncbi:C39 family peptidase [Levilactobacillus cerevisiae]|uniref:C39 family peptidase n=1 Tax=Levilactobacillus cerevisiae TaxID=1704076 RepID=UPI000F7B2C05|nr:C39 family peptidase [Levilactobacillus cerevisiae]